MPATITGSQNGTVGLINALTAVNSTSGTSIDFTGIPSGVKRITVMLNGVSTNGVSKLRIQLGTGGSPTASGYTGSSTFVASGAAASTAFSGVGFDIDTNASATTAIAGSVVFTNLTGNTWVASGVTAYTAGTTSTQQIGGAVTLAGTLNFLRVTTVGGTDTFDAGSINILYE